LIAGKVHLMRPDPQLAHVFLHAKAPMPPAAAWNEHGEQRRANGRSRPLHPLAADRKTVG
jgi:hypothetical protein